MDRGPNISWKGFLLGTAMGGLLMAATSAVADVPKPAAPVQANNAEARKLLADAQAATNSGNLRLALIHLKKAIQIAPSYNEAHVQLALVLFRTGDAAAAEREVRLAWKGGMSEPLVLPFLFQVMLARGEFQEVVDEFPDPGTAVTALTPNLLKARAFALQRLGRGPEATDAVDRALKLGRDAEGLVARATISLQQGDFESAKKFTDEALKLAPATPQFALFKLSTLKAAKDNAAALAYADQLLAKYPGNIEVQLAHIDLLLDQKQYAKAKAEIDAIRAKQPALRMPIYFQALLLSRTGNAKGAWDTALTLPKELYEVSSDMALGVAQIAVAAGRKDAAADILGRALGNDTGNVTVRRRLVSLYLDQGNAKSALNLLSPVENSSDPETVRLLSRTYTALKRKDDAQAVLKRLGANREHALEELRVGHTEQAIAELKEAAVKEPANVEIARPLISALIDARRFAEALEVSGRLGQNPQQRTTALVFRGNILMAQRSLQEAKAAFDKAVGLEPKNPDVILARADFFITTKKYGDAAKDLQAVLASDPKNSAARVKLAALATAQGKPQHARKMLGEAVSVSPQDAAPRLALIRRLVSDRDLKGALKAAEDLLRLQPSNSDAVNLRGQIQVLLNQRQEAVESFRRLVSLTPNSAQAQLLLGNALFVAGDRAGALAAMDAAADISPQSPGVANAQIDLQFAFGNADSAVSRAQAFQTSYPGSEADALLADTLTKAKRFDQASDVLTKSLARNPNAAVLWRLAKLKVATKDAPAAKAMLLQWLSRNPNDTGMRHNLAMVLLNESDVSGARVQYEAILKQDANDVLAMNNLGGLIQASDQVRAAALFTKAVQLAPGSANVNDSLGWLKVQQKDAAGGLPYLQRAHNLDPQDASVTYHLVAALDANGKRNDARALLKSLLASGTAFPERQVALKLSSDWR